MAIPIAFLAGVASFFAPCVVPLLPAYIGYVTGVTTQSIKKNGAKAYRRKILLSSLYYIVGFSLVFVLMGTTAASFGFVFRRFASQIQVLGGILLIFFGLDVAGYLNFGIIAKERKLVLPKWAEKLGYSKSFLLGIIFAVAWSPCIGPILGSILALAAVSSSVGTGAVLLFVYSLGISLPFLIISLGLANAPKHLKIFQRRAGQIAKIAGFVLIAIGATLVLGWYAHINSFVLQWLGTGIWM